MLLTSENIGKPVVIDCARCHWPSTGLMVKNANGQEVHWDDCPSGEPPVYVAAVAADILNTGKDKFQALANLQAVGQNPTREAQFPATISDAVHLTNPSGREEGNVTHEEKVELDHSYRTVNQAFLPAELLVERREAFEKAEALFALRRGAVVVVPEAISGVESQKVLGKKDEN